MISGYGDKQCGRRRTRRSSFPCPHAGRSRIDADEEARIADQFDIDVDGLPRGMLVGTVEIVDCRPLNKRDSKAACFMIDESDGLYAWLLGQPERAKRRRTPKEHPQPGFFNPF
jgi:hypothetical protein